MTIGRFPEPWNVAAARAEAKDLKRRIDRGEDPLDKRQREAAEPLVKQLAEEFLEERVATKRPETRAAYTRYLQDVIVPTIGGMKVKDVGHRDVRKLHRKISEKRGPVSANRMVATLSALWLRH